MVDVILCITAMGLQGKVELADSAPPSTGMETSWPQQVTVAPFQFHLPLGLSFIVGQCDWSPGTRLHRQISVCATEKKEALKNSLL